MKDSNQRYKTDVLFAALAVFLLGFFLFADLGIRYIIVYGVMGIIWVAGVFCNGLVSLKQKPLIRMDRIKENFTPMRVCYAFMVVVMAVLSVMPGASFTSLTVALSISMLLLSGYVLFANPTIQQVGKVLVAFHVMAIYFSCYILLVKIYPDFFWKVVHPLLSEASQAEAERLLPLGYGVPVGASPIYADYIICIALIINAVRLFFRPQTLKNGERVFAVLSSVLYVVANVVISRRTETLCVLAVVFFLFLVSLDRNKKREFKIKLAACGGIVVLGLALVLVLAYTGKLGRYTSLITTLFSGGGLSAISSGRMDLWKEAWGYFCENPLFGIGWHRFISITPNAHEVHNTYLQWLCETGIVGFLLMATPRFLLYFMSFNQARRLTRVKDVSPELKEVCCVSLGIHTFLLLADVIDPAYYHQHYFAFYGMTLLLEETALRTEDAGYTKYSLREIPAAIWKYTKLK